MPKKVAIMLDGGFVKVKMQHFLKRPLKAADFEILCKNIMNEIQLSESELLRVYYYDAPPYDREEINPIDGSRIDFKSTALAINNKILISNIELLPYFAVRKGQLTCNGWKLGKTALKTLSKTQRPISGQDIVPNISQKGVDMRIGLDIAWIALKGLAEILILVTGDSDFIPAMKLARKEGVIIYLMTLGHSVMRELKVHADLVNTSNCACLIDPD